MKIFLTITLVLVACFAFGQVDGTFIENPSPFNDPKYKSDTAFIRITNHFIRTGTPPDVIRKVALPEMRQEMAEEIKVKLNRTLDGVFNSLNTNYDITSNTIINETIKQTTQQLLRGSRIMEYKEFVEKRPDFRNDIWDIWMVLECPRIQLNDTQIETIYRSLPDNIREKTKADFFNRYFRNELRKN
ncbi:MAG: hypothetical protein U0X91_27845 [Spirosomataceae bacterium]